MSCSATIATVCPYCGVGCGMLLQVEEQRVVKVIGNKNHPTNFGRLCTKGATSSQALRDSGRLEAAFIRTNRQQDPVPTEMDAAISATANRLRDILNTHGRDALSFYVSGQMSLEAQYLINKLAKGFIGTNNIDSNSRLCMSSAASGYKLSLGADGPPGSYQDMDHADVFFVIGANMADCHPILFLRVMDRVKAGAKLIVVDPRRNTTADKASLFMQIKSGTDMVLLNGLLHLLIKNGHTDAAFIDEFTEGWQEMPSFLESYTPESVAEITGIPEADIRQAAQWIGEAGEWMSCWTMGLNQSTHGTWHTNAICNLHLATGKICRLGSGPFSLTGQPNAMGGREVGYLSHGLPGQRTVTVEADRHFIEDLWQLPRDTIDAKAGPDTITMFQHMQEGKIKACWIICTNPVATVPNRKNVIAGLQAAELVITQDAFLDTETNRYADILLPAALWAEADGVMINSERNLTLMQKAINPPHQALPDWQIIARVACEMGYAEAFSYTSAAEVFEEITHTWNPKTGYDIRGASHERLKIQPLQWPCPPDDEQDRHPMRYLNSGISQTLKQREDGSIPTLVFPTASGKAQFIARPYLPPAELPDTDFPFILNTGRLAHQWHTMTKTGKIPTLNKLNSGPFVEIHPEDAKTLGIKDKDQVEIRSRRGRAVLPATVTNRVLAGACFTPFHWNDVFGEDLAINAVTNDAVDPQSLQPEFKFCAVMLTLVEQSQRQTKQQTNVLPAQDTVTTTPHHVVFQDSNMSRIDTFAKLLGFDPIPMPSLSDVERTYLSGFMMGLQATDNLSSVPCLPVSAPLAAPTKLWLDGVLAGLFSHSAQTQTRPMISSEASPVVNKPTMLVLWASQTGNTESLANHCAEKLRQAGNVIQVSSMADFAVLELAKVSTVLLLSSTYGDGDPPDNGQGFWESLNAPSMPRLEQLCYAVLALGDPSYDQFCQHGKQLDNRLEALGAKRLVPRIDCDPDYQAKADHWLNDVQAKLTDGAAVMATPVVEIMPSIPVKKDSNSTVTKDKPFAAQLLANVRLNAPQASKETRHYALSLADSGLVYNAGDALGVWPTNCHELVNELLTLTKLSADTVVTLSGVGDLSIYEALSKHCEIAKPSAEALAFIAERTKQSVLNTLLSETHKTDLKNWLWGRQLADLLHEFPTIMSASELMGLLKRLQPRLYSISSSPKAHEGEVHLTVAAVRYQQAQRARKGVSSTFLADRATTVPIFLQKSSHFRPPAKTDTPMIMVGPGTGVAPFRAFLHERQARGDNGKNWLFFGEQHAATDFYYRDELESMQKDTVLSNLSLAFSRDQAAKVYVQDRMREQGRELWAWLQEGAHFYVCGDASKMAKDVDQALRDIAKQHGGLTEESAKAYVQQLSSEKRYVRDVY